MLRRRPLGGAAKAGSERKIAHLRDGPIETEPKGLDAKAVSSTASITDAKSRQRNYKTKQEVDKTEDIS